LTGFSAGIAHRQDPQRMTLAASTSLTSRGVMNGALEQRTTKDLHRGGELGCESLPFVDGLLSCHR
jgi:hypothetical protein